MLVSLRFLPAALFLALAIGGCSDGAAESDEQPRAESSTADEVEDLQYMREEEKLARDVYLVLFDAWGVQTFANIASSEQTHTDAVAQTIEVLGIEDPVVDDTIGIFVEPRLVELYDTMLTEGLRSSLAALHVGATIEEVDMIDIKAAMDRADDPRIIALYESLLCGSRNHLRAFTSKLEAAGHPYIAQFLDPSEVDSIVSSPREACAVSIALTQGAGDMISSVHAAYSRVDRRYRGSVADRGHRVLGAPESKWSS